MYITPQENDCGVVPCVVLCDFDFRGLKVDMGFVANIANVCYDIYGWDWGLGFRVWVVLVLYVECGFVCCMESCGCGMGRW